MNSKPHQNKRFSRKLHSDCCLERDEGGQHAASSEQRAAEGRGQGREWRRKRGRAEPAQAGSRCAHEGILCFQGLPWGRSRADPTGASSSFPPALVNLQDKQPPVQGLGKPRSLAGEGGRHSPARAGLVWTEEKVGGKPLSLVCSGLTQ